MGTLSWRGQETGCLEANHTEAQVLQENSQQQPQTNTFPDLTQGVSILSESVLALYNDKGVILNNKQPDYLGQDLSCISFCTFVT